MAVGPDVHRTHGEETERYVLTNLNMVRACWGSRLCGQCGPGAGSGAWGRWWCLEATTGPSLGACGHSSPHPGLVHSVSGLAYLVGRTRCKPEAGVTFEAQGPGVGRDAIYSYPPLNWGVQRPASCSWVPVLRDSQAWPLPQRPFDLGAPQLTLARSGAPPRWALSVPFLLAPPCGRGSPSLDFWGIAVEPGFQSGV